MGRESALLGVVLLLCGGAAMARVWGNRALWVLGTSLAVATAVAALRGRAPRSARGSPATGVLAIGVLLAGALRLATSAVPRPCDRAFQAYATSRTLEFTGVVSGFPEDTGGGWRVPVTLESIRDDTGPAGVRVLVASGSEALDEPLPSPGARVRVSGRFYLPDPPANPGEPDMRLILARQGVSGTVYIGDSGHLGYLGNGRVGALTRMAVAFRNRVSDVAAATLEPRHAALLCGMIFGSPPPAMQEKLEATGTSHLFAVSGLHVGFVAVVLHVALAALHLPVPVAVVSAVAGVWIYALACGLRASVVRAALMFSFVCAAGLGGRKVSARASLHLAALVMVAMDPRATFDVGAQLSFAVVFSVLRLAPRIERMLGLLPAALARSLALSCAAQVGATPLVAWYFGKVAPIGVIANIPCVALSGAAVTIGFSAGLLGAVFRPLAFPLGAANAPVLSALEGVIDLLARVPYGCITVARPPLWFVLSWYCCIVTLGFPPRVLRRLRAPRRLLPIALAAAVTVVWVAAVRPPVLEVVFLSVGQGDSVFLRSPSGRSILIDGGGRPGGRQDPGAGIVVPYLARRGVRRLDVVVATHPHEDHVGGIRAVLESCSVRILVKPVLPESLTSGVDADIRSLADERGVRVVEMARGGVLDLGDGVRMDVLNPPRDAARLPGGDPNALSLVIKLTFGDFGLLLPGDAGGEALLNLRQAEPYLRCSVLKVPHHGAAGSCPEALLSRISAAWAVVSVGPNVFGHPAPGTIRALEGMGTEVLRTDRDGAVIVTSDGRRVRVRSVRGGRRSAERQPLSGRNTDPAGGTGEISG